MARIPSTPLFVKTHDFNTWLLGHTQRFPKHLRHTLTHRIETLAYDFEEKIIMANSLRGEERLRALQQADGILMCLRVRIRYAADFKLLSGRQIQYVAECLDELGRLLGAWVKGTDR